MVTSENLILTSNKEITKELILRGNHRNYKTTVYKDNSFFEQNFSYKEKDFIQYTFESGIACSGSYEHGFFGIIDEGKYYCQDFSKSANAFLHESAFWKNISGNFVFNHVGKLIEFNTPINLWFNTNLYWHWFLEDLPIIKGFSKNSYPIVTNKLTNWQKESIKFFNIENRIVEVETPCRIKAPKYFTFSYPSTSNRGKSNKFSTDFLKKNLISKEKQQNEKIYISRGDAVARKVENENEVVNYLSNQGFICYSTFSNFSLQEKLNKIKRASLVVSPTGAGLTHVHAMDEGSTVIDFNHGFELDQECGWNNIGDACRLHWYTFAAKTGKDNERSKKGGVKIKNRGLIVDIEQLKVVIDHAINKTI